MMMKGWSQGGHNWPIIVFGGRFSEQDKWWNVSQQFVFCVVRSVAVTDSSLLEWKKFFNTRDTITQCLIFCVVRRMIKGEKLE